MKQIIITLLLLLSTFISYSQVFYAGEIETYFNNDTLIVTNVETPYVDDPTITIDSVKYQYIFQGLSSPSFEYSDNPSDTLIITACKVKVTRVVFFFFNNGSISTSTDPVLADQSGLSFTVDVGTILNSQYSFRLNFSGNFDYAKVYVYHIAYGNPYLFYIGNMQYFSGSNIQPGNYIVNVPYRIKGWQICKVDMYKSGCVQSISKLFQLN